MTILSDEDAARAYVAGLCDEQAMARLERLAGMLIRENERQNLVAAATLPSLWLRHFADSAQLIAHVPRETSDVLDQGGPWIDLGTGAGFPGLVIAAMRPDWDLRMIESRRKRVEWLDSVRVELGLARSSVVGSRLELVESFPASAISARAFAPLPRLLDLSTRFSTNATLWLLPKGRSAVQELETLPESKRKLFHVEQSVTDAHAGIIVGTVASAQSDKKKGRKS